MSFLVLYLCPFGMPCHKKPPKKELSVINVFPEPSVTERWFHDPERDNVVSGEAEIFKLTISELLVVIRQVLFGYWLSPLYLHNKILKK
jgi:hypothetical protein